jgi:hypothetical protein
MRKTRLLIVFLGLVVASGSAGADPAGDELRKFGLIGTWAPDCDQPASRANPYMTFTAPSSGSPARQLRTGDATLDGITQIEGAHTVNSERLEMSFTQGGIKLRIVIEMAGRRTRTIESIDSDGRSYIRDGKITGNNRDAPWFSRCSAPD